MRVIKIRGFIEPVYRNQSECQTPRGSLMSSDLSSSKMKLIAFALLLCAQVLGSNSYISATEAKECIPKLRALFSDVNSMLGSGAQGSVYSVGCERRGTGPKAVKMCGYVLKLPGQALNAYPDAEVELMQRSASEAS